MKPRLYPRPAIKRRIAHHLGTALRPGPVIAEGVETEGQRLRLAALGCTNVQGYLFGRPMPSASIEEMIRPYGLREMVNA